jgi:IS30 family transposase
MANLLKMAVTETIRTLHRRGWSQRRIADELGINRETVARHLRRGDPQPKTSQCAPRLDPDRRRAKTSQCVPRLDPGLLFPPGRSFPLVTPSSPTA